mmetsp:Transcript_12405/g.26984  ORF Transcript_12405/g.26984 Transcript_12405/m.26984 type:complete len:456 (-) Transcript_12405:666-2033(-)
MNSFPTRRKRSVAFATAAFFSPTSPTVRAFAPPASSSTLELPFTTQRPKRSHQQRHLQLFEMTEKDTVGDQKVSPVETNLTPVIKDVRPVYATSEEASTFLAEAPVTPDADAFMAEETVDSADGLFWRGVVVVLCALWASNFACAKVVLAQPGVDASLYAVARFSVAALSLLPFSIDAARRGKISWETTRGSLVCGSWVAFGYLGQTLGLMTTTPSKSCVICSLNCIFVALVAELWRVGEAEERGYKTQFDAKKLIPALVGVAGVAIIELKGSAGEPVIGDLLSFAQPVGFGLGYLLLEDLMKKEPEAALPVSCIKLTVVTLAAMLLFELSPHSAEEIAQTTSLGLKVPDFTPIIQSPMALAAIFYTGLITTSLALYVESVAFQRVPATDASIILTTEPLFAAAISAVLVGETFGTSDAVGAACIIGACVIAVLQGKNEQYCDEKTEECTIVQKK